LTLQKTVSHQTNLSVHPYELTGYSPITLS
jgi:hypothetical protein